MTSKDYAIILDTVLSEVENVQEDDVLRVFILYLKKEHAFESLDSIIKEFSLLAEQKKGINRVYMTSSEALPEQLRATLKELGKLEEHVDRSMIGGATIQVGDTLIDGSIRTVLKKLKRSIAE